MSFTKHDAGKLRMDLICPEFEAELAKVLTDGAAKYTVGGTPGDNNWQNAAPAEAGARYVAAARRHLNAYARGKAADDESGSSHLVHAACSLMFLRWFERKATAVQPEAIRDKAAAVRLRDNLACRDRKCVPEQPGDCRTYTGGGYIPCISCMEFYAH